MGRPVYPGRALGQRPLMVLATTPAACPAGVQRLITSQMVWLIVSRFEIIVGTGVGGGQDKSARTLQKILQEKEAALGAPATTPGD